MGHKRRWSMTQTLTIEAIRMVRIRYGGRDVIMQPGQRLHLPYEKARQLLAQAEGKVRKVGSEADWVALWREVAEVSSGLVETDPRRPSVLELIVSLDRSFEEGHLEAFRHGVNRLRRAMQGRPGK